MRHHLFGSILISAAVLGFGAEAARADIIYAYVLIESKDLDQDAVLASLSDPGMCKWITIGRIETDEIGVAHTFVRFDCEGEEALSNLVAKVGTGVDGITRVSVLESFGRG